MITGQQGYLKSFRKTPSGDIEPVLEGVTQIPGMTSSYTIGGTN